MRRALCLTLALSMLVLTACSSIGRSSGARIAAPTYESYRRIPGVTQEEIDAVEALKLKYGSFSYGHLVITEAFQQADGNFAGFTIEVCALLSELFQTQFNPKVYNEWIDLKTDIDTLATDFSGEFTQTAERMNIYKMTTPIAGRGLNVYQLTSTPEITSETDINGMRVGFLGGAVAAELIIERYPGSSFEIVDIPGFADAAQMLLNGELDAFVTDNVADYILDQYHFLRGRDIFRFVYAPVSITTKNPELAPIISVVNKYLDAGGMDKMFELYREGSYEYKKFKLSQSFTDEERAYLARLKRDNARINVALQHDAYPASFYNTVEERYDGAAYDILTEVGALTGIEFNSDCMPIEKPLSDILAKLKTGEVSMMPQLLYSESRKNDYIWSGISYITTNYALLSKNDYPSLQPFQVYYATVGTINKSAHEEVFKSFFPDHDRTIVYQTGDEGFDALERGEIDLLMLAETMLLVQTNYREKLGYKVNLAFDKTLDTLFGYHKDEVLLRDIIDKSMAHIDVKGIEESWLSRAFDYQSKMLRDMIPYAIIFSVVLLAALFVVFVLFIKNKKISRNLEVLVTERTNELALQTSALTTIFESIPDLVFCKDLNFIYTRCNPSLERYLGMPASEVIGKSDVELFQIDEEMAKVFVEADQKVLERKTMEKIEELVTYPNGTQRMMETIKTPLIQNNEVIGMMGISRDITERKAAEETLKLTLDNLDACVYITEIETGEILFINNKMKEEYGDADCIGKKCWTVLQNQQAQRCDFCAIPKLLESGDKDYVWEGHSAITGKYYKNTDSLIKWHDGRLVHMQHAVDITDLIKLQWDLESASKAKGDFLSRMSHEIRTPLNAIMGMISIAMSAANNEKTNDCLVKASNASKHLLGIINDILDMSKIEADKFELDSREFDFEKMLMSVTNVTSFRAEEKKQNFIVDLNKNVPGFIIGDDLRLSQVITNLLTNAVKFTPEYGTVILRAEMIEDSGGGEVTLRFEIEDNGIGISQEQQERLFTSFEQADGGIARKYGGTGLGLAISKRIVELMGGSIWIESELDQGSKFIFTLKAGKGKEKARAMLSPKISMDELRILAVDDSPEIREYFAHVMDSLNLPCDVAGDGAQALEMMKRAKSKPYNIFFVDWQMPHMDGIELTRRIKQTAPDNSVVFMISANEWGVIEKDALAVGVRSFISKPLFPSILVNAINECIEIASIKPEAGAENAPEDRRDFSGHTILIAEDVEINREIMSAVLEDTGLMIDYAENGAAAVSMLQDNLRKYSLVLMDIQMPEMDGYEATRRIRALDLPGAADIPIIAMTANVFREDIENCLSVGMNDHIGKPIDQEEIFTKLEHYLRDRSGFEHGRR